MAVEALALGFYISIPGTITYPANEALREVVRLLLGSGAAGVG